MLGNSIATLVRVTPSPTTLAESSAVFRKLKDFGQVRSFIEAPSHLNSARMLRAGRLISASAGKTTKSQDVAGSSLYYAVIANPSPTLNSSLTFDAPVYHDLRNPKDEDPFNIRGLQDRKPYPEPITFSCVLEQINDQDRRNQIESLLKANNPYTEEFRTVQEQNDVLQSVLRDTKAPLPVIRGLGRLATLAEGGATARAATAPQARKRQRSRSDVFNTSKAAKSADEKALDSSESASELMAINHPEKS